MTMQLRLPGLLKVVLAITSAAAPGALHAQNAPSLNGTFGFLAHADQLDSVGANGGAVVGLLNFDGAGGVTGTYIVKPRTGQRTAADSGSGALTGTYTLNPDGTGLAVLNFDAGFSANLSLVITSGGQEIQFADVSGAANTNITFSGADPTSLTGAVPLAPLFNGVTAKIPVSLTGSIGNGTAVYTSTPASGSGTVTCSDGSAGTWTAAVPSVTAIVNGDGTFASGNFLLSILFSVCGSQDFETASGFASASPTANGGYNLVLRATGQTIPGFARATGGTGNLSPNGSYGFHFDGAPFPQATIGVINFDGAGNATASVNSTGVEATFSGTYATNPDGTGTINLTGVTNPAASVVWSFVTVDGGATLLVLRVDGGANGADVVLGTARLQ